MLTKRQLADMAYGVRELSKKLGSVRLRLKVKTVFLLTKAHDESLVGHTRDMVEWLLSKERETPYIVYGFRVEGLYFRLILSRYVEDTLEHNHKFDAKSIVSAETSREGRLKYWNNELCKKHPLTFDFAVTVLDPQNPVRIIANTDQARRRWHPPLCQLAFPENRTSGPVVLPRLPRFPYQVRLFQLPRNTDLGFQGRRDR